MIKRIIRFNFSNRKWARKYIGGYWEKWYVEIIHGPIWMYVTKEQAYNLNWRPGTGRSTPIVEYYPINYFGDKMDFTDEVKIQKEREAKLQRLINEEKE